MNRRNFIKAASGLLVPAVASAQSYLPHRRKAFQSSAWTPASLGATLVAEWVGDAAPSGAVSAWASTYGGFSADQATGAQQPDRIDAELNGHHVVRFSGTDFLGAGSVVSSGDWTVFVVWKTASSIASTIYYPFGFNGTKGLYGGGSAVSGNSGLFDGATTLNAGAVSASTWYITRGIKTGTSYNTANDGNAGATGALVAYYPSDLNFGRRSDGSWYSNSDIAYVGICDSALSQANYEKWEGWAAHTYGLTANLPGGHPYKSTPP